MKIHTPKMLREVFWYNPISGEVKWKAAAGKRVSAAGAAGTLSTSGYIRITYEGVSYSAHHLAWALFKGKWPLDQLDHRDGDRTNNAIANLRECSCAENQQNKGISSNNKSGFVGVSWNSRHGGWAAKITANGKVSHLGVYSTREAAAKRYAEEKRRLHKFNPEVVTRRVMVSRVSAGIGY